MPERARSSSADPQLDLTEDDGLSTEALDDQVQKAQEALLQLKRQQEMIERQKRELEELSRRQEQLNSGKSEMLDKFTRAMVVLEREVYEAKKRVELLESIHESFTQHIEGLEAINPKAWEGLDINKELTKALSTVDDSRVEYANNLPKISPDSESDALDAVATQAGYHASYEPEGSKDFMYWLKAGFAFTLPLLALGIVLLIAVFSMASSSPR
jgi:hypothetical protein